MKRAISLALAIMLIISSVSIGSINALAKEYKSGDFKYTYYTWVEGDDSTNKNSKPIVHKTKDIVITDYTGKAKSVTIPSKLDSKKVVSVGEAAFYGNTSINEITVSEGLLGIDFCAFGSCSNLTKVTLPSSCTYIAQSAFVNCKKLSSINLPYSIKEIGYYAFAGCAKLGDLTLPPAKELSNDIFAKCNLITRATVRRGTKILSNGVFNSSALKYVYLPSSITEIKNAFTGYDYTGDCTALKHIYYAGTKAQWKKINIDDSVVQSATIHYNCPDPTAANMSISGIKNKYYTAKSITQSPVVKFRGVALRRGVDYTVSYSANKGIGTAKVVIKGKGAYRGSVTKTFKISLKGTSIKSLIPKSRGFIAKWNKAANITGYKLQYSTDKSFKKNVKTVTIKKASTLSKRIYRLSKKKTYYVRIKAYKTSGSKTYYSAYSEVKKVKTK